MSIGTLFASFRSIARAAGLTVALAAAGVPVAGADMYMVNSPGDDRDASPGDGACLTGSAVCTLRAAIQEANMTAATKRSISTSAGAPHG